MTQKSNKEIINEFFKERSAAKIDKLFWEMYISLQYSNDYDSWGASEKEQAANLYKDVTGLINNLELSTFKNRLS